ncbi:creatininase family protein [Thermoplasmatota archaeon]
MKSKKNSEIKKISKIVKFEELNWKQIQEMDKKKTIFYLIISPLEEHGPHLPIGTDLFTARDVIFEATKKLNKIKPELTYVILPSIPIGSCRFNTDFPGSISVNSKIVRDVVYSFGSSLAQHGFQYMVISTFHMAIAHLKGIYSAMNKLQTKYDMKVCEPWGPFFYNDEIKKREPKLGFDTKREIHAGFRETSLMKYQYPYLVDESYKKLQSIYRNLESPRIVGKKFKQLGLKEGYVGSPSKANADYGRWFFNEIVKVYVNSTIALYQNKKISKIPKNIKLIMKTLFWE